ncbi:MAG: polyphosphate kinase 1 [Candidatus Kapabacteria bacterium]|nr:polyphosphate kinase 1 [Candidatus Kapabacteria bacterium]
MPKASTGSHPDKESRKKKRPEATLDLRDESLYFNRELSWIEFNRRVIEEAADMTHPLLERLKFLAIFGTNLDEFFMIRVAGLQEQIYSGVTELSADGMTPAEQMKEIRSRLMPLYMEQSRIFHHDLIPALRKEGIHFHGLEDLTAEEREEFDQDFVDNIMPVLTPLALDPGHPFPRLLNRSINIAFVLTDHVDGQKETKIAVLQLPSALPRLMRLPRSGGHHYVLLDDVIRANAGVLFPGLDFREAHVFRVTRDADVEIADDEAGDLITAVAEGIRQRRWGTDAVRLEIGPDVPRFLTQFLARSLDLETADVYQTDVPMNLQDFLVLMQLDKRRLKDPPLVSRTPTELTQDGANIFDVLKEGDVLVHHPFDSFTNSVVTFLKSAARDPQVLAIKITLYRAGGKSPVIDALREAAENGKNVTAFVELKARFDEETNIAWARALEQAGVHVVYGLVGLKTHCKVCLVIRKEGRNVLTYAHVATGNYNLSTSRLYTDVGIFTARQEFERDFVHLFNLLTGYSKHRGWQHIGVAPVNLRENLLGLIEREIEHQRSGTKGHIVAKMNALIDPDIIRALYKASQAGVRVELIVRGVCTLRPGIAGVSDNITVRSVLDRFLEHSRIFRFRNGGDDAVFISSADWMTRNMHRRVELLFPVYDQAVKKQLKDILDAYLHDNVKARMLTADGTYQRVRASKDVVRVQHALLESSRRRR